MKTQAPLFSGWYVIKESENKKYDQPCEFALKSAQSLLDGENYGIKPEYSEDTNKIFYPKILAFEIPDAYDNQLTAKLNAHQIAYTYSASKPGDLMGWLEKIKAIFS